MSADSGAILIEISGQAEEDAGSYPRNKYTFQLGANHPGQIDNLQSPVSADSVTGGIQKGSMSLSSSTSKDNHPPMLGMVPEQNVDQSLVNSSNPDITFGQMRSDQ